MRFWNCRNPANFQIYISGIAHITTTPFIRTKNAYSIHFRMISIFVELYASGSQWELAVPVLSDDWLSTIIKINSLLSYVAMYKINVCRKYLFSLIRKLEIFYGLNGSRSILDNSYPWVPFASQIQMPQRLQSYGRPWWGSGWYWGSVSVQWLQRTGLAIEVALYKANHELRNRKPVRSWVRFGIKYNRADTNICS